MWRKIVECKNKTFTVANNTKHSRFEISIENGEKAVLDYRVIGDKLMDFYHTEVPPSMRGKGIAAVLTKGSMLYAREHNMKVIPSCSYISDTFLPDNKEFYDCVAPSSILPEGDPQF